MPGAPWLMPWRGVGRARSCWSCAGRATMAATGLSRRGYWPSAAGRCGSRLLGAREALKGDAAAMAARWTGPVEAMAPEIIGDADLVIDALFGAGLARPIDGVAAEVIAALDAARLPVRRGRCPERRRWGQRRGAGYRAEGGADRPPSSGASPAICCCPGAAFAARPWLRRSALARRYSTRSGR